MEPFFFGPSDRQIFGIFHPPARQTVQDCGVVFCQPLAHEFYNTHRCSRQLAGALSDTGLAVLRFDYFGTGDSAGAWEEASVAQWLDDIGCAVAELRRRGYARLCLAGLRFGATLAAVFSAERGPADALVLWEPVASGESYLRELEDLHSQMVGGTPVAHDGSHQELLGFEYRDRLRQEIGRIDLRANRQSVGSHVLLIESPGPPDEGLRSALEGTAGCLDFEIVQVPQFWFPHPAQTPLPRQISQRMSSWIASVWR
jgi:alpha/beta superfamily hydrolase